MSTLVVDELITTLVQEIKIQRPITLAGLRPWLYSHDDPNGSFDFGIYRDSNLVKNFTFTVAELKTAMGVTQPYFHGHYAIPITPFVLPRGTYELRFSGSGYTYNTNKFIGWCKDIDPHGKTYGTIENYTSNPYSFTLIEYKNREL